MVAKSKEIRYKHQMISNIIAGRCL